MAKRRLGAACRRERGIVLVVVLLLTMVLALIFVELAFAAKVDLFAARNRLRSLQARCALVSGREIAEAALAAGREEGGSASAAAQNLPRLSFQLNGLSVVVEVRDEDAGFPGSLLSSGGRGAAGAALTEGTWQQAEATVRGWVGEMGCKQQDAWFPVLQPLMRELRWAAAGGVARAGGGLLEAPTFWTDGRVNANTASPEALRAVLSGAAPEVAACILNSRTSRPFASDEELTAGLSNCKEGWELFRNRLKVTSDVFRVGVVAFGGAGRPAWRRTYLMARAGSAFLARAAFDEVVPAGAFEGP